MTPIGKSISIEQDLDLWNIGIEYTYKRILKRVFCLLKSGGSLMVDAYLDRLVLDENNSREIVIVNHFRLNSSVSMLQHLLCEMSEVQSIPIWPLFEISEFVLLGVLKPQNFQILSKKLKTRETNQKP